MQCPSICEKRCTLSSINVRALSADHSKCFEAIPPTVGTMVIFYSDARGLADAPTPAIKHWFYDTVDRRDAESRTGRGLLQTCRWRRVSCGPRLPSLKLAPRPRRTCSPLARWQPLAYQHQQEHQHRCYLWQQMQQMQRHCLAAACRSMTSTHLAYRGPYRESGGRRAADCHYIG